MRAELIGQDPGRAQLRLHGVSAEAGDLRLQIRRNQGPDSYLGGEGRWQSSPDFWFQVPASSRTATADGIDIAIGPEIVDPIAGSLAGNAFQVTIDTPAGTSSATIVIPQQPILLASGAAGVPRPVPAPEPEPTPAPSPEPTPPPVLKADPDRAPIERPSGHRFALIVGILVVVIALAVAAYFLKDRFFPPEATPQPQADAQSKPDTPAQSELDQIKTFLSANPNAQDRLAKARETLAACQLNWASTLYRDLGQAGDAEAALAMGRLYDPVDPVCPAVGAPSRTVSSDTAAFWYRKAIDAKSAEAQRRLGAMLVAAGKDDPKYQEGIDLLKAAAAAGDADAAAKLKELGQ